MLRLLCPKCKNAMNYQGTSAILGSKRKRCVYCGKTFIIKDCILKRL